MIKLFLLTLSILILSPQSHAGWRSKRDKDKTNVPQVAEIIGDDKLLSELVTKTTESFAQLQTLMTQRQYQAALTLAKSCLDQARIKVGIDPKSVIQQYINLPNGVFANTRVANDLSLDELTIETRNTVLRGVLNYRGGLFLDLLNLLKRTNLIYIEAFYQTLKSTPGGLMEDDTTKIRNDIVAVMEIPLYLRDPQTKISMLVFDSDVANSDQNYLFNRELKTFLLANAADLYPNSNVSEAEEGLEQELATYRNQRIKSFRATERPPTDRQTQSDFNPYKSKVYSICAKKWYEYNASWYQERCINDVRAAAKNDQNSVFLICYQTAINAEFVSSWSDNERLEAVNYCASMVR